MFPFGIFGIDSDGLNLAVNLLILCLVVIWLATVYWTYADARRRMEDPMLIGCATAASFFPFVGCVVYMIVRPPEYLDDVRERELEMQAAEARVANSATCSAHTATPRSSATFSAAPTACAAEEPVCELLASPRPAVEGVPVLRGRGGPRRAPADAPPAAKARRAAPSRQRWPRSEAQAPPTS